MILKIMLTSVIVLAVGIVLVKVSPTDIFGNLSIGGLIGAALAVLSFAVLVVSGLVAIWQ